MAPHLVAFAWGYSNSISNEDWRVELEDVVVGKLWSKYRFGSLISSHGLICFPIKKKQDSLSTFKPWLLGLTQELEEEIKRLKALPKPKQEVKQEIKQTTKPVETKEILGLGITCFWCFKFQLIFSLKDSFVFFCTFWFPCTDSIKCSSFDNFFFVTSLGLDVGNSGRKRRRNSNRIHRPFPRHRRKKWHQPLRKRMYHLQWWKRTGNWSKTVYSCSVDWGGEQNPHPPKLTWQWRNKAKTTIWVDVSPTKHGDFPVPC